MQHEKEWIWHISKIESWINELNNSLGDLNRVQSSRRLERETQCNIELMPLIGRLTPDFKTISNFRKDKDNGKAIRQACSKFVLICKNLNLFTGILIPIDGSK